MKALITGGSKGLGFAIAQQLLLQGIDVVIVSRSESNLNEAVSKFKNPHHQNIETIALDLSVHEGRSQLKDQLGDSSELFILVNNLGMYYENSDVDNLSQILNTNLYSAIEVTSSLESQLIKNSGYIFNIGSVMSLNAQPFAVDYSISKHALKAWNDSLREKLRSKNVSVSAIYPGAINTSSWDGENVDRAAMIQAEDIASLIGQMLKLNKSSLVEEIRLTPLQF